LDELPVHYLNIFVAVDVKTSPKLDDDNKTYAFEGEVSGYYSDPIPISLKDDRQLKSRSTHTTTQYFYADVSPRLDRVLSSPNMKASTKIFVDGDYRFPEEENSTPGYIEVRNVTFNSTARTSTEKGIVEETKASGGGGNRRNVTLKSTTSKPRSAGGSSRTGPGTDSASTNDVGFQGTPGSAPANNNDEMSFALAEFEGGAVSEGNPRKRGPDTNGPETATKRQKKPNAKA
jgi:hypothetical protein